MPPLLRPPDPSVAAPAARVGSRSDDNINYNNIDDDGNIRRGRSRTVSRIALARRASEERKAARRAGAPPALKSSPFGDESQPQSLSAAANAVSISSLKSTAAHTPAAASPSDAASPSHQPLPSPASSPIPSSSSSSSYVSPASLMDIKQDAPVAGPSVLPNMANAAYAKHVASATARPHSPYGSKSSTPLFPDDADAEDILGCANSNDEEDDPDNAPLPPRSLQDQMQEAYAAEDMHTARILFLRIKGIEVTGDDDPRIAEVRDEDFEFVPGGILELDEEILAGLEEARERRRQEEIVRQRRALERERARKAAIEAEAARREAARLQARKCWEKTRDSARVDQTQPCNIPGRARMQDGSQLRTGMLVRHLRIS